MVPAKMDSEVQILEALMANSVDPDQTDTWSIFYENKLKTNLLLSRWHQQMTFLAAFSAGSRQQEC